MDQIVTLLQQAWAVVWGGQIGSNFVTAVWAAFGMFTSLVYVVLDPEVFMHLIFMGIERALMLQSHLVPALNQPLATFAAEFLPPSGMFFVGFRLFYFVANEFVYSSVIFWVLVLALMAWSFYGSIRVVTLVWGWVWSAPR